MSTLCNRCAHAFDYAAALAWTDTGRGFWALQLMAAAVALAARC